MGSARARTRSLRKLCPLEALHSGLGRRFLALQDENINCTPMVQPQQAMLPTIQVVNDFAARILFLLETVNTALADANAFFDDMKKFFIVLGVLNTFGAALAKIVDSLKFLQCPTR